MCCSTWEEMTTDKKHPISQSSSQHITQDQLTSLQPPCMYNPTQPRPAIMDATLNLDLSPASIPSFASIPGLSASSHSVSFPVSHMGCVDTVNGNCMQQHACNPRSAAEKTGKHSCHVMSDVICDVECARVLQTCRVWKICVTDQACEAKAKMSVSKHTCMFNKAFVDHCGMSIASIYMYAVYYAKECSNHRSDICQLSI